MSDKGNLPSDPAYNARHRNPISYHDDYDKIVNDSIEGKEQLKSSINDEDMFKVSEDNSGMKEPFYAKLDDPSVGTKGETEFPKYPETERYAKQDLSIDEQYIRQNKGMGKLQQKTDSPADETPTE